MDSGTNPVDADEIIQRHGRRLFVLACHLSGDAARARDLAQECLVRSLLEPSFPAGEREAAVYLMRGLVSLWKERLEPPARSGRPRFKGAAPAAPSSPEQEHAVLWRALSRLDPTSRAVLVLRVAGDLEYETIGRVLDMAADVVYARLLQSRSRLHPGDAAIPESLFETMNLYLDGRLPGADRGEFERRLQSDAALRGRVEFHRGLALELHEDAPPLPRDFATRIHDRLDRTRETLTLVDQAAEAAGWGPAAASPPTAPVFRMPSWRSLAAIAALVVLVAATTWRIARRAPAAAPEPEVAGSPGPPAGGPQATPDEATIEALRSLGYLAPAREHPGRKPAAAPKDATPRKTPVAPNVSPAPARKPTPDLPEAQATPVPPALSWRAVQVGKAPDLGRDHQVIRTGPEWAALFEGAGAPEVAFDRDMVILLRRDLHSEPPSILVIASVAQTAEALVIECRREAPPAGPEEAGSPAAGQAIILPISDLPVRVIVR